MAELKPCPHHDDGLHWCHTKDYRSYCYICVCGAWSLWAGKRNPYEGDPINRRTKPREGE